MRSNRGTITMNLQEVMTTLESQGSEQTRKTWRRHGSGDNIFGVNFADLKVLAKKIKCDHELACQLWETQNVDAQTFATMILDPQKLDEETARRWVTGLSYYALAMLLAGCIAQSGFSRVVVIDKWIDSDNEFMRQCAYDTLTAMLKNESSRASENCLSTAECRKFLVKIESEIAGAPNRVRYSMNSALIAIGIYKAELTDEALKCADRIGKVVIDHGDTGCKTPDARPYIEKAVNRKTKATARR